MKRYDLVQGREAGWPSTIEPHPQGDWCSYEDVEALERQLCAVRRERDELQARIDRCVDAMRRGEGFAAERMSSPHDDLGKLVAGATFPVFVRVREALEKP